MMHARYFRPPGPVRAADTEQAKTARLRELRLASEAASREAGTWGAASVGEITHGASGTTFVFSWTGRQGPDLEKLLARRAAGMTVEEHEALVGWVLEHRAQGFQLAIHAWNLSAAEARRVKHLRIAEHKAAGRPIINNRPARAAP
jgi:hypothetical protein